MSADMPGRVVCLDDVRRRREEILSIAESYGVRNIRVFVRWPAARQTRTAIRIC